MQALTLTASATSYNHSTNVNGSAMRQMSLGGPFKT